MGTALVPEVYAKVCGVGVARGLVEHKGAVVVELGFAIERGPHQPPGEGAVLPQRRRRQREQKD
ncbi:MAG: hypothetical protein HY705_05910 [Gemmatimonadetes bacterium]|nr:hypothetical protein [Gemmatimonadota bacterium]